jgi:hypothetical protein
MADLQFEINDCMACHTCLRPAVVPGDRALFVHGGQHCDAQRRLVAQPPKPVLRYAASLDYATTFVSFTSDKPSAFTVPVLSIGEADLSFVSQYM